MTPTVQFASFDWDGRVIEIEYQWVGAAQRSSSLMLFLHEGLGSLAMWKDFPERLCANLGCRGLVFSRPGYGQSSPRAADEKWQVDFMHRQAFEIMPALLEELGIDGKTNSIWLFGHSDGASIALLYAAKFVDRVDGLIVLSPHIMVEELSIKSIEFARSAYLETDLKTRLAKYHDDPDSAFWGWNDIWLHADFRDWSIEEEISTIRCPLLAVQGIDDEYGTLAQVYGIAQRLKQARVVELADCGHSPHRDQPEQLIDFCRQFFAEINRSEENAKLIFNQVG